MRWYCVTFGENENSSGYRQLYSQEIADMQSYNQQAAKTFSIAHRRKLYQKARLAQEKAEEYLKLSKSGVEQIQLKSYTTYPRHENRTPVNVEFSCSSFSDEKDLASGKIFTTFNLKLFSQSISFFTALKKYSGTTLKFEAGWDDENDFFKKLGYNKNENRLIYQGQIAGITGTFTYDNNFVNITNSVERPYMQNKFKWKLVLTQGDKLFGDNANNKTSSFFQSQKRQGRSILSSLSEALGLIFNISDSFLKIYLHPNLKEIVWDKPYDKIIHFSSFESLNKQLYDVLGIQMGYVANKGIAIYATKELSRFTTESGFNMGEYTAYKNALINECFKNALGNENTTSSVKIGLSEMVVQPTLLGFSQELEITTILKPQIMVGSTISLPNKKVFTQMGNEFDDPTQLESYLNADMVNRIPITAQGDYIVTAVEHKGNFYDTNQTAWATTMRCIPKSLYTLYASGGL